MGAYAFSRSETGVYNGGTGELDNVKFMGMREKIVAMKDDAIKAGVEEAKELEAENAPCTIAVLLFSKMLAASLTQRVATETKKNEKKKHCCCAEERNGAA